MAQIRFVGSMEYFYTLLRLKVGKATDSRNTQSQCTLPCVVSRNTDNTGDYSDYKVSFPVQLMGYTVLD